MEKKYNILICFARLGAGGIETACITQIKEFVRRGYNVFVMAEEGIFLKVLNTIKGIMYISFDFDSSNSFNLDKIQAVQKVIIENNIKLVYMHQIDCVSSVFSACMITKTPYVAYVHHGILGVYDWELKWGNMSNNFLKLYYKFAYKIITINEQSREENKERFNIEDSRYEVIPNCIDFENFKTDKDIDINKVLLLSRLEVDKGNGILNGLKFFKEYKAINPKAELIIVGGGSLEEAVKKQVEDLGIECNMLGIRNDIKELMEQNGIILGVDRCIQEAIAMRRLAVVTGYEGFQGLILPDNIEKFAKNNFSKKGEESSDFNDVAKKIYSMKEHEKNEIIEGNYNWLIKNRSIKEHIYEITDIDSIKNPLENIDYKKVIEILFGELQYMHTWMQKEIDRGWDARQKTEDYYLSREKWNEGQIQNKDAEIQKLKKENEEVKDRLNEILKSNSWKFIKKIRNNKVVSKILKKINSNYGGE